MTQQFPARAFKLAGEVETQGTADSEEPFKFSGIANSGQPFDHWLFGKSVLDLSTVNIRKNLSVLLDHDHAQIAGKTTSIEAEDGGLQVEGELYRMTDAGQQAIALLEAGHPYQMSASVPPRKMTHIEANAEAEVNGQKLQGPLAIWSDIDLREVTLTAVGADEQTHAAAALSAGEQVTVEVIRGTNETDETMTNKKTSETPTMTAALLQANHADVHGEVFQLGEKAERERISWILSKGSAVGAELTQKAIEEGWDRAKCADAFLDAVNDKKKSRLSAARGESAAEDKKLSHLRAGENEDAYTEGDFKRKKTQGDKSAELAAVEQMPLGEARYKKEWELSESMAPEWAKLTEEDYIWARKAEEGVN